jgi:DNA-directed RNA polymerase specialized sigma24 family protein
VAPLTAAIEPLILGLRRYARAWLRNPVTASDLVYNALNGLPLRRRTGRRYRAWFSSPAAIIKPEP